MSRMNCGVRRTTDATVEPVSIGDAVWVQHTKIVGSSEDDALAMYITTARQEAEKYMRRALIEQSWTMTLDRWPGGEGSWWDEIHRPSKTASDLYLRLPYPPLISITSIDTYDTDDVATSITVGDYFFTDTNAEPGRLVLRAGVSWPVDTRRGARIKIIYKAGYGDEAADVPMALRHAVMKHALWEYEHRGMSDCGNGMTKSGARAVYSNYRIVKI